MTTKATELLASNEKMVKEFGASEFSTLREVPDFRTFRNNLFYSHRDFDVFYSRLLRGDRSAIVSGLNPSGRLHIGHKVVFDTCLFFQQKYKVPVYIPLSDDESYVSEKVEKRTDALAHAITLTKGLIAYGFDPDMTKIILDFNYPEIFNIAINLSRKLNFSKVKGVYGYSDSTNVGLAFYPAVQAAHVLFPEIVYGIDNTLVPIGPDEDAHLRLGRSIATEMGYAKPAIVHARFMPDLSLDKMSKSRPDGVIYLDDSAASIKKKVQKAFSGGQGSVEEHRRLGGNPETDVAIIYLTSYFLAPDDGDKLRQEYRSGKLLSGDVKKMLIESLTAFTSDFNRRFSKVDESAFSRILMPRGTHEVDPILLEMFRKS